MADTAEQTENQEQEQATEQKPSEQKSDDNQKAIDEALAAAKAEWEKDLEQKLKDAENEGARKAKLTNEQRKKEDDDKEREEFEKAKNRCICRNGTCQSRIVCRDCKVHHSRG